MSHFTRPRSISSWLRANFSRQHTAWQIGIRAAQSTGSRLVSSLGSTRTATEGQGSKERERLSSSPRFVTSRKACLGFSKFISDDPARHQYVDHFAHDFFDQAQAGEALLEDCLGKHAAPLDLPLEFFYRSSVVML